jgi:sugar-specific transcriptional regulator TrmB
MIRDRIATTPTDSIRCSTSEDVKKRMVENISRVETEILAFVKFEMQRFDDDALRRFDRAVTESLKFPVEFIINCNTYKYIKKDYIKLRIHELWDADFSVDVVDAWGYWMVTLNPPRSESSPSPSTVLVPEPPPIPTALPAERFCCRIS